MVFEKAYAKINLTLDVVRKRDDGFHELKMIMIPVDFYDELIFEKSEDIELVSNMEIPNNAVIKTAKLMKETFHINQGVKITLKKNIPIGAGLAGGSADIAATIRGLNQFWEINKKIEELENLALSLGSDTLFCLYNKPAYVYGRGDYIEFIHQMPIEAIYLFLTHVDVSTKNVFLSHKINHQFDQFPDVYAYYLNNQTELFLKKTYNHLTKTTLKRYPYLKTIYKKIRSIDHYAQMSGSGSTFYILSFNSNNDELETKIKDLGLDVVKTRPKT